MDLEEKSQMEGPNDNVFVVERKRSTLSRLFNFKTMNEFNENAMAHDNPDSMPKNPKTSTLMRLLNKKQQPTQQMDEEVKPEASEKSEESQGKRNSLFSRAVVGPWISRKMSQMSLNRSKAEPKSEPCDETTSNEPMSTEEIHEILIAN